MVHWERLSAFYARIINLLQFKFYKLFNTQIQTVFINIHTFTLKNVNVTTVYWAVDTPYVMYKSN